MCFKSKNAGNPSDIETVIETTETVVNENATLDDSYIEYESCIEYDEFNENRKSGYEIIT